MISPTVPFPVCDLDGLDCRDDAGHPHDLPTPRGQDRHEPWTRELWGLPLFPSLLFRPRWSRSFSRFVPFRSSWSLGSWVGLWFGL